MTTALRESPQNMNQNQSLELSERMFTYHDRVKLAQQLGNSTGSMCNFHLPTPPALGACFSPQAHCPGDPCASNHPNRLKQLLAFKKAQPKGHASWVLESSEASLLLFQQPLQVHCSPLLPRKQLRRPARRSETELVDAGILLGAMNASPHATRIYPKASCCTSHRWVPSPRNFRPNYTAKHRLGQGTSRS